MSETTIGLRWAIDQLELANLVARLAHTADAGTLEDYADCFAVDAEWWPPATPGVDVSTDPVFGIKQIVASAQERRDRGVQGPGTNTRHVVSTSEFVMDGPDAARGRSYWRYYIETNATPQLLTQGEYRDHFVRIDGRWRLRRRRLLRG